MTVFKHYLPSKRTILLSAFFILSFVAACSNPDNKDANESSDSSPSPVEQKFSDDSLNQEQQNLALLSLSELLGARDVKEALASAAKANDTEALRQWQSILLDAADEVNLTPQERKLLEGDQGLMFLEFQGMKTNYQRAFESAFYEFEDLDKVYSTYPAFKNLHERSQQLVKERDKLVASVAEELESQGFEGDATQEAKRQWQNYFDSQQAQIEQ